MSNKSVKPTSRPSSGNVARPATDYRGGIKPSSIKPATPPRTTGSGSGSGKQK